jgi:hypothetical protein
MQEQTHDGRGRDPDVSAILEDDKSENETEADSSLTKDDVFEVLYNRRRREVLSYMREHDGTTSVSDLAEYIAAKENDTTVQQLSSYDRKRVYVGLYQNHLPMMDDVGVVEYDKNRGTVEFRDCATELEPYLDDTVDSNISHVKVLGASFLAVLVLLSVLNVGFFGASSDLLWTILGVAGLLILTIYDEYAPILG